MQAFRPLASYGVVAAGGSVVHVGILAAVIALPAGLLSLFIGRLVSSFGVRFVGTVGSLLVVTACVFLAAGPKTLVVLYIGAIVLGAGHMLAVVAGQSVVTRPAQSGAPVRLARYSFSAGAGQMLGPLLLMLPARGDVGVSMMAALGLCAIGGSAALVAAVGYGSLGRRIRQPLGIPWTEVRSLLRTRGMVTSLIIGSVGIVASDLFAAYLPLVGRQTGVAASTVGLILLIRGVGAMAVRAASPVLIARLGRWRVLQSSIWLSGVALIAGAGFPNAVILSVMAFVFGVSVGLNQPLTMLLVSERAASSRRVLAMSVRVGCNRIAQVSIPVAVGLMVPVIGARGAVFLVAMGFMIIGVCDRKLKGPGGPETV